MKVFYLLFSLVFPVIFLYPQGILSNTYFNYFFVAFSALILFFFQRSYPRSLAFRFFFSLFSLNLFSNSFSLFIGNIDLTMLLKGNAPLFLGLCLSYIISIFPSTRLNFLKNSLFITFSLALLIILLDGLFKPQWIYDLFYLDDRLKEYTTTIHHRAIGTFLTPVMSGFFCGTVMTYSLIMLISSNKNKYFFVGLFGISAVCLILTASRTNMLAILLMFASILFLQQKNRKNLKNLAFLLLVICILIFVIDFTFLNSTFENLQFRNEQFKEGAFQGTGRTATFLSAIKNKFDYRCFGWGIGTAEYSIIEQSTFSLAHNGFLSIFLPFGLIGIILYFRMFKKYIRLKIQKESMINNTFVTSWIFLTLGTFFSADMPVSLFYIVLLATILSFNDRINQHFNHQNHGSNLYY